PDNYFRGFPTLWNAAAFYLFLIKPAPWLAVAAVALLAALTFAPFPFIHPFRVARLRVINVVMLAAWAVLALLAIHADMAPEPWIVGALTIVGLYFLTAGALRRALLP